MSISEGLVSASLLWFGGFSIHQAPSKLLVFKAVRDRRDFRTVWFACFGAKGTEGLGSGYVVQGQPAGQFKTGGLFSPGLVSRAALMLHAHWLSGFLNSDSLLVLGQV